LEALDLEVLDSVVHDAEVEVVRGRGRRLQRDGVARCPEVAEVGSVRGSGQLEVGYQSPRPSSEPGALCGVDPAAVALPGAVERGACAAGAAVAAGFAAGAELAGVEVFRSSNAFWRPSTLSDPRPPAAWASTTGDKPKRASTSFLTPSPSRSSGVAFGGSGHVGSNPSSSSLPSGRPSRSVSGLLGSVFLWCSSRSVNPSPSVSRFFRFLIVSGSFFGASYGSRWVIVVEPSGLSL